MEENLIIIMIIVTVGNSCKMEYLYKRKVNHNDFTQFDFFFFKIKIF